MPLSRTMKRRKSRGESLRNEDMISQLPEALLLNILSLLPIKDVVAMSVLSKQWQSLWKMVPKLKFSYEATNDHEAFSDNICRCLLSRQAPVLETLHLELDFDDDSSQWRLNIFRDYGVHINIMMGIAFGLQVYGNQGQFRFPRSLYNCETIKTLKLSGFACSILVDIPFPVCLKSLRTLHFHDVAFKDDESVLNLLSGCFSLESLEVHRFEYDGVETFTIAVPSLQRLTITLDNEPGECSSSVYVINAPSLKYLEIKGFIDDGSCLIENTPELVEANIIDVAGIVYEDILGSLTSVKRLFLQIASPLEFPIGSIFYQLVYLELHTCEPQWWNLLMLMLDSSPKLQILKLISKWFGMSHHVARRKWSQPENVPECLLLHLETLVWTDYEGQTEDENEVAKYILRNASRLKKATFSKELSHSKDRVEVVEDLESVVMASNSCQLVLL